MSITVTHDNFEAEVLSAETPVLVDFWAPWCGPCKAIAPIVESLAEEHAGRMSVAKVNVDDDGAIAAEYGVRGIPTLVLFQDGEIKGTMVGAATKEKIDAFIEQHID